MTDNLYEFMAKRVKELRQGIVEAFDFLESCHFDFSAQKQMEMGENVICSRVCDFLTEKWNHDLLDMITDEIRSHFYHTIELWIEAKRVKYIPHYHRQLVGKVVDLEVQIVHQVGMDETIIKTKAICIENRQHPDYKSKPLDYLEPEQSVTYRTFGRAEWNNRPGTESPRYEEVIQTVMNNSHEMLFRTYRQANFRPGPLVTPDGPHFHEMTPEEFQRTLQQMLAAQQLPMNKVVVTNHPMTEDTNEHHE